MEARTYFKVIDEKTKYGSNAWGFMHRHGEKRFIDTLKECPEYLKFFPKYSPGATITAPKGTVGIFCFASTKSARDFVEKYNKSSWPVRSTSIIKVESYSIPLRNVKIIEGAMDISELLRGSIRRVKPPNGSVLLRKIKVIE